MIEPDFESTAVVTSFHDKSIPGALRKVAAWIEQEGDPDWLDDLSVIQLSMGHSPYGAPVAFATLQGECMIGENLLREDH